MTTVSLAAPIGLNNPLTRPSNTAPRLVTPMNVRRNVWTRGRGRVAGTVKEASTPSDLPLRRRVRLFNQLDGRMYGETWSDATTGAYSFDYIDETAIYYVVAHDYTANYNAVIKDGIVPEVIA